VLACKLKNKEDIMKKRDFWGKGRMVILLTVALMLVSFSAYGADKLLVKDGSNNTKFVVEVDPTKVGIGTDTPLTSLHVSETDGGSSTRGVVSSQHYNGNTAAVFQYMRSRGTDTSPLPLINGDAIGAFHFLGYDGSAYQYVSSIVSRANGTVGANSVPGELRFHTGLNSADNFSAPKMVIGTTGIIKVKSLEGSYVNGSAYVCVNNNGELFASETACP